MVSRHNIARASRSCGAELSNAPARRSLAKRLGSSPSPSGAPYSISSSQRICRPGASPRAASRSATAMLLATSRRSRWASGGNRGSRSLSSTSRASANKDGPVGKSRTGRRSVRIEKHQNFELTFCRPPSGQREIEIAFPSDQIAVALLQRDDGPAYACQHLPEEDALSVYRPARFPFVTTIEGCAVGDSSGLAIEPREAPTLAAKPTDVFVRVAPAGELPIQNAGQIGAVEHVVAGAIIVMAEHRLNRRRKMRLDPTDAPFEDRPRYGMFVEIGTEPGNLLRWSNVFVCGQEGEIGARRADRVDTREFSAEVLSNRRK